MLGEAPHREVDVAALLLEVGGGIGVYQGD